MPAARRPHTRTPAPDVQVVSAPTLTDEVAEPAPSPVPGLVQRRETGDELGGTTAAPEVTQALARRRGGGRAMAPEVSQRMGEAMGVDVSGVRIHDDHEADTIARSVQSVAFAQGTDLYFTQGTYAPGTPSGDHLLAHELAHTTQTSSGGSSSGPTIGHANDPAEAAADQVADGAVARLQRQATRVGDAATPGPKVAGAEGVRRSSPVLRRDPDPVAVATTGPTKTTEPDAQDEWSAPTASPNPVIDPDEIDKMFFPAGTKLHKHDGEEWRSSGKVGGSGWTVDVVPLDANSVEYAKADGTRYSLPKAAGKRAEHAKETGALFPPGPDGKPVKPRPEDVVQGALGDCFLEAALSGLARTSPDTIMGMIRDLGDHVTVRLHDVDRTDPRKPSFTPRYVKVEKSRVTRGGKLVYDGGALWVGMVEKAYVAGRFGGNEEKTEAARGKAEASYESIDGGQARFAFEVLLGKPAARHEVDQGSARVSGNAAGLPWSEHEMTEYAKQKKKLFGSSYTRLATHAALGKDTKKIHAWFKWLDKVGDAKIGALYQGAFNDGNGYKHGAIRVEDFTALFTTHGLAPAVADPMLRYLETYFPGKRGTGKYSADNLKVFTTLRDAVLADKTITLGSHETVGRSSSGSGHSGGEDMSKGMVGGHAFTVLSTKTNPQGVRYVQIRNPWGKYGREYDAANKPNAVKDGNGESWIELSDFVKRFHSFDVV